jgi:hypothetical protein
MPKTKSFLAPRLIDIDLLLLGTAASLTSCMNLKLNKTVNWLLEYP